MPLQVIDLLIFLFYGHIDSRRAFGALLDLERHFVAFFERSETRRIDPGMMYEHIRSAIFLFDKTVAFATVKPLYCTVWHADILLSKNSQSFDLEGCRTSCETFLKRNCPPIKIGPLLIKRTVSIFNANARGLSRF
jgi:hypothetical protein